MKTSIRICLYLLIGVLVTPQYAHSESCKIEDKACSLSILEREAAKIDNKSWRDQTYRELAKSLASVGETDKALSFIPKIETPDTQAMTIRGIGMEAADLKLNEDAYNDLFAKLRTQAETITHPPSYAIALTYIAMSQAFAGDNEGAWKTAASMENDALRHKAYGETAEIQAEQGDYEAAMKSIGFIESTAYKNKAYSLVSKILTQQGLYQSALDAAMPITNPYKKAQAIQKVLNTQRNDEKSKNQ